MTGRLQSANAVGYVRSLTPILNGLGCLFPHIVTLDAGGQDRLAATDTGFRRANLGGDLGLGTKITRLRWAKDTKRPRCG